jgi:hypothetical protein
MTDSFDSIWKLDEPMFLEESRCREQIHAGTGTQTWSGEKNSE